MMQHSVLEELRPSLYQTLGLAGDGSVILASPGCGESVAASVSARLRPADVRAFVASRCEALALRTHCGALVVIDFVAVQHAAPFGGAQGLSHPEPEEVQHTIVHCDELHIGRHARICVQGTTLMIRAQNIDVRADEQQRLRGASISIG